MKTFISILIVGLLLSFSSCKKTMIQTFSANNGKISYSGRIDSSSDNEVILIGSAASTTINFKGDSCVVLLKNISQNGGHNYVSFELDNQDLGRIRIDGDSMIAYPVQIKTKKETHKLSIFKSTEASNGYVAFGGIKCNELEKIQPKPQQSIEFIGNSITCGMGNDTSLIPCHADVWYDQHNAYWAYGAIVARTLNIDCLLSSVSGIGIYRNWNGVGPTMPEVYENLYLNLDTTKRRDFTLHSPDIVSICLGTNDLSDGDGMNERLPFDADHFTKAYIQFVEIILNHYPKTQIALLSSPMVKGEKQIILLNCLNEVKKHFTTKSYKPIEIFEFGDITPHGCDYHPSIEDHRLMANQLIPFYKSLLN